MNDNISSRCFPSKVVDEYAKAVANLSISLIEIMSEMLGLEPHVLGERLNTNEAGMRTAFNYYPPCPQPELVLGVSPHADSSILTVLQQDGTPGLEICKDGEWIEVAPIQDALVINLGNQMQVGHLTPLVDHTFCFNTHTQCMMPDWER